MGISPQASILWLPSTSSCSTGSIHVHVHMPCGCAAGCRTYSEDALAQSLVSTGKGAILRSPAKTTLRPAVKQLSILCCSTCAHAKAVLQSHSVLWEMPSQLPGDVLDNDLPLSSASSRGSFHHPCRLQPASKLQAHNKIRTQTSRRPPQAERLRSGLKACLQTAQRRRGL